MNVVICRFRGVNCKKRDEKLWDDIQQHFDPLLEKKIIKKLITYFYYSRRKIRQHFFCAFNRSANRRYANQGVGYKKRVYKTVNQSIQQNVEIRKINNAPCVHCGPLRSLRYKKEYGSCIAEPAKKRKVRKVCM